jgi:hypothetical protein
MTNKQLEYYRKNKKLVKIERSSEIDDNSVHGIILDYSDKFILIASEYDFFIDGWMIINRLYIEKITTTPNSNYCKKILQKEGLLDNILPPYSIDISGCNTIFRSLKKNKQFAIVEDEHRDTGVFLIGPIKQIKKNSVSIRHFDGTGKWVREKRNIKFENISMIRFGCNYIRLHEKYLGTKL